MPQVSFSHAARKTSERRTMPLGVILSEVSNATKSTWLLASGELRASEAGTGSTFAKRPSVVVFVIPARGRRARNPDPFRCSLNRGAGVPARGSDARNLFRDTILWVAG